MLVRDVIARDLGDKINTVVKVYDRAHLTADLKEFVITDSLATELRKFFADFTDSLEARIRGGRAGDGMAVWLWGFFGSGKSHVAKVLGHLLENDVVEPDSKRHAIDLFVTHQLDDPKLPAAKDLKAALKQIQTRAWCKTIAFEIKSKQDQANPESVTETCIRQFYHALGVSPTVWLARLERKLQKEGKYEDFLKAYREQNGRDWTADRPSHAFYLDEMAAALAKALGRTVESTMETIRTYRSDNARVTPENFIEEVAEYLDSRSSEVKPLEPHLIFVIDELGQFISTDSDRIEEVRAIIEQAGVQGRGRIWFICTSQEALDKVVDRTGLKLSSLGKLDARFSVKIPLTGEDVRRVVQDRLLRKKQQTVPELNSLYRSHEGMIEELANLRLERRLAAVSRENFVEAYPFLPHTMPLVQELFNAMRGFKLSGTERSMIDVAQGALRDLADRELGVIVPLDLIFDQETDELSSSDYLGTSGMRLIRESDARITDTPTSPSRVLKALWLIDRVSWIPRTPEVLARLLAQSVDADLTALRDDVRTTLDRLQAAGLVGRDEATGQYRYLSEEERGLEEAIADEIAGYGTGIGIAKRKATEILKNRILTRNKWGDFRVPMGQGTVPFSLYFEDEAISTGGEITIQLYGPLASPDLEEIEMRNLGHGTKGKTIWWLAGEDATLVEKLKRLRALEEVPQQPRWRGDRSDETVRVLKEKEKERASLESHVAGLLESTLRSGRVYYSGEEAKLDGSKSLRAIAEEFVGAVASHLYTRFAVADKVFSEGHIPDYLKPKTQSLDRLDPELQIFDRQGHLLRNSPLVEALFEELKRREDENESLEGKEIAEHFERVPFGWPNALVRLVLAAMFRGGAIHLTSPDSDQPIFDLTEPGVEGLFTGLNKFRKTRFHPTSGGLTPAEVKEAKEALIAVGETGVPDAAHQIAERVRVLGERMRSDAESAARRVEEISLPVPDTYRYVDSATQAATSLRDPVQCVRKFVEDRGKWQEAHTFLAAYRDFIENNRDKSYQTYQRVLAFVQDCPEVFRDGGGEEAKEALQEYEAIVAARQVMPKWKELQAAAHRILDRYRAVYRAALDSCVAAIDALKEEVQESASYQSLEEARRPGFVRAQFGPGSTLDVPREVALDTALDLLRASERKKVRDLDALRMGIPGYRIAIFDALDRALEQQAKESGDGGSEPGTPRVFRVQASNRLSGRRFSDVEAFRAYWEKLGSELVSELNGQYDEIVVE